MWCFPGPTSTGTTSRIWPGMIFRCSTTASRRSRSGAFTTRPTFPCRWGCWWMPAIRCATASSSSRNRPSNFSIRRCGPAMYDALYFASRDKLLKTSQNGPVRRAIILLSDGDDNMSHVTREEAIDMAQRAEVIVYTISTNVTGTRRTGDKVLERIADATGGRAFFPFQLNDVANAFFEIQDELRSQYALSYKPADFHTDGRYHTIEIMAQNHKGLRVRSRRGYFAPNP